MKKAISLSLALVVFTAIGSVNLLPAVPYVVFGAVVAFTLLVATNRVDKRYYPIYIFGLSLSLLWQTSMLGTFIVGVDIHTEYFVANNIINNGWDPNWANNSNTSPILALLAPALDRIGIDVVWQFKLLYPMVCALTPVFLYYAFRRRLGENRSYYAILFFMTMPMFTMEVVSIVKSQWAYMFLAVMVFFMTSNYKHWKKALGITGAAIGAALSHYAIGTIMFAYIVAIFGILLVTNWGYLRRMFGEKRMPLKYMVFSVVPIIGIIWVWYANTGSGCALNSVFAIGENIFNVTRGVFWFGGIGETPVDWNVPSYLAYTNPVAANTYLDNQAPLVRAAIGLDFMLVSGWGKAFRVFQYLTQILMVFGFIYVLIKKGYGFTAEYMAGVIASFGLLAVCLFIPFFTTALSPTRFYVITLFFIAPLLIIAVEQIAMRLKWARQ